MQNIRFAGFALLSFVSLGAQVEGAKDDGDLVRFEVGVEQVSQVEDRLRQSGKV